MNFIFNVVVVLEEEQLEEQPEEPQTRRKPKCTACGNPMKGHKFIIDYIKNQR